MSLSTQSQPRGTRGALARSTRCRRRSTPDSDTEYGAAPTPRLPASSGTRSRPEETEARLARIGDPRDCSPISPPVVVEWRFREPAGRGLEQPFGSRRTVRADRAPARHSVEPQPDAGLYWHGCLPRKRRSPVQAWHRTARWLGKESMRRAFTSVIRRDAARNLPAAEMRGQGALRLGTARPAPAAAAPCEADGSEAARTSAWIEGVRR